MLDGLCVGCFTLSGLTVASPTGYTGYIGSRERVTPMNEEKGIAAVERVAAGLHKTLEDEFRTPMGGVETVCEWTGEDFNRIVLVTPVGKLFIIVTSVVGEEGADVRVAVFDSETFEFGGLPSEAHAREVGRVARAVAAIDKVDSVWLDAGWPRTFLASVRPEEVDS